MSASEIVPTYEEVPRSRNEITIFGFAHLRVSQGVHELGARKVIWLPL